MKRNVCTRQRASFIGLLAWLTAFGVAAADTPLDQGMACLEAKRYEDAVRWLRLAFRQDPANADISYQLGLAAAAAGDYEGAAAAFDRVLVMRPDDDLARLELARSYYHLQLYSVAEELFREVAAHDQTPTGVRRTIDEYLQSIRKARCPHEFSGSATLTIARDDNARISPGGTVNIPGLPRLSVPVNRDLFTAQNVVLTHRWTPRTGGMAWASELLGYNALYLDQKDLDVQYIRLDSGPRWKLGRGIVGLGLNGAFMEKDFSRYLRTVGARAFAGLAVTQSFGVQLEISGEDRHYWDDPQADGFADTVSLRPEWALGRHRFSAEVGFQSHHAEEGYEAYDKASAGLGYQLALPWRLTFLASCLYEDWRFAEAEVLSPSPRHDRVQIVGAGLRRLLGTQTAVELRHKIETSHSNSDLYSYDRQVTTLSLTRVF